MSEKITNKTVKELADDLKAGKLTAEEITQAYIDSIESQDTTLQAYLTKTFDQALEKARAFDQSGKEAENIVAQRQIKEKVEEMER